MNKDLFAEAARLALLREDSLNVVKVTAIKNLREFLDTQNFRTLTTFLRLAHQYVILLETDPLLVGVNYTYILSGNGTGGLAYLDKDISATQSDSITQYFRTPGLRAATPSELVDMLIAHSKDPSDIVDRIHATIDEIAARIVSEHTLKS